MSTRAQIGIYEKRPTAKQLLKKWEVLLYRHSDGYPGNHETGEYGVLSDIVPFLRWFDKNQGISDTEYAGARLMQYMCNLHDGVMKDIEDRMRRSGNPHSDVHGYGTLGYGVCKTLHLDIEYFYAVYPQGVDIYRTNIHNKPVETDFDLIQTVPLEDAA
jgi:hypothetical protein